MKTQRLFWQWLISLLLGADPYEGPFRNLIITANKGNAPPSFDWSWYGCRYGLWRKDGKPVPIRTTWFRRT